MITRDLLREYIDQPLADHLNFPNQLKLYKVLKKIQSFIELILKKKDKGIFLKSNLKNILFLLQIIGHPRDSKRIKMLQNEGFYVSGLAFERPYHKGRMPTCNLKSLGRIENKKYVFRLIKFIKSIPKIRTSIKQNDFVYTSGQDMAFLAFVSG